MSRILHKFADDMIRRAAWRLDRPPVKPRQVIVDVTDQCFFRCPTCDKWRVRETPPELTTDDWRQALGVLRGWLGPFHLSISGGEPLLRDDILDLVALASGMDCTVNLMTNGWLVDGAMAEGLVRAGLGNLTLSLNGLRAETHDATRGVEGSHARVLTAIEHFNRARSAPAVDGRLQPPTLSLNVIVAGYNARELPDLVRWAREVGVDAMGLQPLVDASNYQPYSQRFRDFSADWTAHSALWSANPGTVGVVLDELTSMKGAGYPILNSARQLTLMKAYFANPTIRPAGRCYVGLNSFLIDPYGAVRLCYAMDAVGDIRLQAPRDIWGCEAAARVRVQIRACGMGCRLLNCNYQATPRERVMGWLRV
jgi:MoaA/NifB/PqqE/SkfB family radical SAM enzyme